MKNPFSDFKPKDYAVWAASLAAVIISFCFSAEDWLSAAASLIGVTALIFLAKGNVMGQILSVVFALAYAVVSYRFKYYGEMITYLGMTAPMAVMATVSWLKNPYEKTAEVTVGDLSVKKCLLLASSTALVTALFYFVLRALSTASLAVSTLSVATSFLAVALTYFRSPFYALAYALNDVVLVILWTIAAVKDLSCLPTLVCFVAFFFNDLYGFVSWCQMKKRQRTESNG